MIKARINAGLRRARAKGKRLGRQPGPSRKTQRKRGAVLRLRREGVSLRAIAMEVGLARATVETILRGAAKAGEARYAS